MSLQDLLTNMPNGSYATPVFYGIISGPELFQHKLTGDQLKELILTKLALAYEQAREKIINYPIS